MFKKLLILFSTVIAAAAAASWLANQPGAVQIEWLGWRMELPTSLAVALIIIFALILVFFDRLLRAIRAMPRWLGGRLRQRRDDAGHRALTLGLMAVSAGEPAEARKHASRAERLLKEPKLTGLLVAQAAHLAGDHHQAARRYFTSILDDRETAFLGHIGLLRLALDDHDPVKARQSAKAALALKPNSVLAADHLFKLETGRKDWNAALPALDVMARQQKKTKSKTAPDRLALITRQACALHFLKASELQEDDRKSAEKELLTALKIDPGFLPAVTMLADHYLDDKAHGRAAKILETAFKIHPHDSIATRLKTAWKSNDGQFIAKLSKLLAQIESSQQKTAHFLVARQARDAGLDGEAERLFSAARDLDGGEEDTPSLWHCASCKSRQDDWQAFCPACDEFATLVWQRPAGTSPLIKHNS